MQKSFIRDQFNRVKKSARVALDRTRKVSGGNSDSSLQVYEKLSSVHFDAIAQAYGEDNLVRYIKTMEAKKLKSPNA